MIKDHGLGSGSMDMSSDLMGKGSKLNDAIFGSSLKDINVPGLGGDAKSKLMNLATPMAMGSLGKVVKEKNLDAKGLSSYLQDEVRTVGTTTSRATEKVSRATSTTTSTAKQTTSGGGGLLKWLLPLLLLVGALWYFMGRGGSKATTTDTTTTTSTAKSTASTTATHTHADGTVHKGASHGESTTTAATNAVKGAAGTVAGAAGNAMDKAKGAVSNVKGLSLDDNGNLLKDGKLFLNKGEFTLKDGEFFDKDGKSLGLLAKIGKAIGDAGKAVGGAVGGAAEKTADFFKDSFGGMFKKKKEGAAVSAYSLSKIKFDDQSHKITSFSKSEVEGLAAALKAYPDAKITVQATGGDKKMSKMKAQVIHDMLVTLGVKDKQIDAKGMGEGAENYSIVID